MPEYDLHSGVQQDITFATDTISGAETDFSAGVDCQPGESVEHFIFVPSMAADTLVVTLFEGDTAAEGGWTEVPAEEVLGDIDTFPISASPAMIRLGSIGKKRFQGYRLVGGASMTAVLVTGFSILGNPKSSPMPDETLPVPS